MACNHTPGPWEYDRCDFGSGRIEYGIYRPDAQTPGDTVDYVATVHDDGTEADARLIAEAPAMLEALRAADAFFASDPNKAHDGWMSDTARGIRAILARVDGED